jgi:hypothetical protein
VWCGVVGWVHETQSIETIQRYSRVQYSLGSQLTRDAPPSSAPLDIAGFSLNTKQQFMHVLCMVHAEVGKSVLFQTLRLISSKGHTH